MKLAVSLLAIFLVTTCPSLAQKKIVGGNDAAEDAYPWMVSINTKGRSTYQGQFCGGSLIHESWVVTAAHCMEGETAGGIEVYVGVHNLNNTTGAERRSVRAIYVHPGYREDADGDLYNDIALLLLSSPVTNKTPIDYATSPNAAPPGTPVRAIGWGDTQSRPRYPAVLQEVSLNTVSTATIRKAYREQKLNSRHLGARKKNRDTCQGDSGGPLFIPGGSPVLVGITSFGLGCAEGTPGIYANVGNYRGFLDSFLAQPVSGNPDIEVRGRGRVIRDGERKARISQNTHFGRAIASSRSKSFQIRNADGTLPLSIIAIRSFGRDFRITRSPTFVFGGAAKTLTIRFRSPGVRRLARARVEIVSNDPDTRIYNFRLKAQSR